MKKNTLAILGAGSWGTAVAIHIAQAGHRVLLWGRDAKAMQDMAKSGANTRYLPNNPFPPTLLPQTDLALVLKKADEVCIAVPSHAFLTLLESIHQPPKRGIAWITKGMDSTTHQLLTSLVKAKWGNDYPCAILSGPSFAKEVASGLPTALTLACDNAEYQKTILSYFQHSPMRIYLSDDLLGVQLCGIIKNVLAIACGMSDGLHFGTNSKAALMTRGLAEMRRLGIAMGAQESTFQGLAGLGDLVLTCTDDQSRNRRFGLAIGQGTPPNQALKAINQVVEGFYNANQVAYLSNQYSVHMPICESVLHVLEGHYSAKEAAIRLIETASLHSKESI